MDSPLLVEVSWHGKTLYLSKAKLDEWYAVKNDDHQAVEYLNSHPEVKDPVSIHRTSGSGHHANANNSSSKDRNLQEPDDLVLVHWSGDKVLLLERQELDAWYSGSYEDHVDWVHKHKDALLN